MTGLSMVLVSDMQDLSENDVVCFRFYLKNLLVQISDLVSRLS